MSASLILILGFVSSNLLETVLGTECLPCAPSPCSSRTRSGCALLSGPRPGQGNNIYNVIIWFGKYFISLRECVINCSAISPASWAGKRDNWTLLLINTSFEHNKRIASNKREFFKSCLPQQKDFSWGGRASCLPFSLPVKKICILSKFLKNQKSSST